MFAKPISPWALHPDGHERVHTVSTSLSLSTPKVSAGLA